MSSNTLKEDLPVAIAGAGPVGLAVALGLARAGIRSRVFERKTELDRHSRATVILPRSLEFLQRLGVLPTILAQGARSDAIKILRTGQNRPMLSFDFAPLGRETPTPYAIALSQEKTEAILLAASQETGLVDVRFGTPVERFEALQADGVRVVAGGDESIAPFLVGADGAHSTVRTQLGWTLEGKTYPTRAVLADVRIASEFDRRDGWIADPEGGSFVVAIRFADGIWRIIEAAVPDNVRDADLPARARSLADRVFGPAAWRETLWTSAYRKHERRSPHYVSGRIALAGDAAHLNSPAGGQGLNAGFADAERLIEALVDGLRSPQVAEHSLRSYEAHRITKFDRYVRGLTDALEKMESAPAWQRRLGFAAVGMFRTLGAERVVARRLSMVDAA